MDPINYLQQVHRFLATKIFAGALLGFLVRSCKAICKISPRCLFAEILLHSLSLLVLVFLRLSFNLLEDAFLADRVCLYWMLLCLFPSLDLWLRRFHDLALSFPILNSIHIVWVIFREFCFHLTFWCVFRYQLILEWMI